MNKSYIILTSLGRQCVLAFKVKEVLFAVNVCRPEDYFLDSVAFGAKDVLEESSVGGVVNGPIHQPIVQIVITTQTASVLVLNE